MDSLKKSLVTYQVPYADTDQMGVVYYANYLVYFERCRNQLLRDLGFPYKDMEKLGFALPVVSAHVDYKAAAAYDDTLTIDAWVAWIKGVRLQVNCEVLCGERVLATGYTIHACMDIKTRRPVRVLPQLVACCPWAAAQTPSS